MGNPVKGEVEFEARGVTYTLRFTVDAIVKLETATGRNFPMLAMDIANPEKISMALVRQLFWAGLQDRHPELSLEAAGELMPVAGGLMGVLELVGEALRRAFPQKEAGGKSRPRSPGQKRTGPAS